MKKIKQGLVCLCAGALLFSATSSMAMRRIDNFWVHRNEKSASGCPVDEKSASVFPKTLTYEDKAKRIVNFLEKLSKLSSQTVGVIYGFKQVRFSTKEDNIILSVYGKGVGLPEFEMIDRKDNGYHGLDKVSRPGDSYESVNLNREEEQEVSKIYKDMINEFYSQNKRIIEQDKKMEALQNILNKK